MICVFFVVWLLGLFQRALGQLLDDGDHFLDRDDYMHLRIVGEDDEGDGEDHASEESRSYLERGSLLYLVCVDNTSVGN